jgi:hypothetical protein
MGRGLPMPGTLSGQGEELKDINGKLYDYLQILLWVGMNNYDNCDNYEDDRAKDWDPGNRELEMGTSKLVNGKSENHSSGNSKSRKHSPGNENSGNGKPRNKGVGKLALGGCLEIVGLPDDNERILADNMDGEGVTRLVNEAKALKSRKERLIGRIGKDTALLEKRYARYESSHRTLRTLQLFGGLACLFAVAVGMIIFRPR